MEMYLRFNQLTFATEINKVLAARMHLKGEALEWFQPYMKDYFDNWNPKKSAAEQEDTIDET